MGDKEDGLTGLMLRFRTLQAREIWAQHGAWIEATRPNFGPEIAARTGLTRNQRSNPKKLIKVFCLRSDKSK